MTDGMLPNWASENFRISSFCFLIRISDWNFSLSAGHHPYWILADPSPPPPILFLGSALDDLATLHGPKLNCAYVRESMFWDYSLINERQCFKIITGGCCCATGSTGHQRLLQCPDRPDVGPLLHFCLPLFTRTAIFLTVVCQDVRIISFRPHP